MLLNPNKRSKLELEGPGYGCSVVPVERWLGEEVFRTDVGRSFVCTSQQTLLEGNPGRVGLVSVNFYDTQVEAFRVNMTSSKFHAIGVYSLVTGSHLG